MENKKTRYAAVSGGTRGIGRAISLMFAANGIKTLAIYEKDEKSAEETERAGGGNIKTFKADIGKDGSEEAITAAMDGFSDGHGADITVCNAGISSIKQFQDITPDEWRRIFEVNFGGAVRLIRAFLPGMIERKNGRIITVSSMWGERGASCESHYSATKGAIESLTKSLSSELAPSGITVNSIAPGLIDTEMNAHLDKETKEELIAGIPAGRIGRPEDVASAALFLAGEDASYITGQVIRVDGGIR